MTYRVHGTWIRNIATALFATLVLGGCLSEEEDGPSFTDPGAEPPSNAAPRISGTPPRNIDVGETYSFVPTASDNDGDALTFSITNRPSWASFNASSGRLSGSPTLADVGTHADIVISVSDGTDAASLPAFSITVSSTETNSAPQISGSPPTSVNEGQNYTFMPSATDADGDTLTFSIAGAPSWASFDSSTGRISGTPGAGDVGVYSNIIISVSDGQVSDALPAFSITVNSVGLGSVTLSWTAPTQNEDGSQLIDLAGYKIYWGTETGVYTESVTIDNPSITTYVVENLSPGTYEFAATAYNASGIESQFSGAATKVIQ